MCGISTKALENKYSRAVIKFFLAIGIGLGILFALGFAAGLGYTAFSVANTLFTGFLSWSLLSPLWKCPLWLIISTGWGAIPYTGYVMRDRLDDYLDEILYDKRLEENQKRRTRQYNRQKRR